MIERICQACGQSNLRRSSRHGLLEMFFFSLMGYYPWRCKHCGTRTLLHDRGSRVRHSHQTRPGPVLSRP